MRSTAIISSRGRFRYELRREWDDTLPPFVAGMLNPLEAVRAAIVAEERRE